MENINRHFCFLILFKVSRGESSRFVFGQGLINVLLIMNNTKRRRERTKLIPHYFMSWHSILRNAPLRQKWLASENRFRGCQRGVISSVREEELHCSTMRMHEKVRPSISLFSFIIPHAYCGFFFNIQGEFVLIHQDWCLDYYNCLIIRTCQGYLTNSQLMMTIKVVGAKREAYLATIDFHFRKDFIDLC